MFCPNCGKELPEGGRFCPTCGRETASGPVLPPAPARQALSIPLNSKTLLALAGVVIMVLLAALILRPGEERTAPPTAGGLGADTPTMTEPLDPTAALVGSWSGRDNVGLRFTEGSTVTLSGFGLDVGGDTFTYSVTGPNTLTLTAQVGGLVSAGFEAPYFLSGDGNTLQIELAGYLVELTRN